MDGAGGEPSVRRIGGNCRGAVTEELLSRSIFSRNEC
jgi:hypothetical protein